MTTSALPPLGETIEWQEEPRCIASSVGHRKWVRRFGDIECQQGEKVGGKAMSLARMTALNLPVPRGYCIVADGLERFLALHRVTLPAQWSRINAEMANDLVNLILHGRMPDDLLTEIVEEWKDLHAESVAVRSSAIDEDRAEQSFAGQHVTVLFVQDVDQLVEAIRRCWSSLFHPAALAYRTAHVVDGSPSMAVVVQVMVNAEAAGVGFAINPVSGDATQMIVEACLGMGEGLVSGRIVSDGYTLDAQSGALLRKSIRFKPEAMRRKSGSTGVECTAVAESLRQRPVLSDEQIAEVGQLLKRLSGLFSGPQDIEWAYEAGRLSLLQCRPITTAIRSAKPANDSPHQGTPSPAVDNGALWSRMDIGEIFTGRMTPLGISFAKHYQYKVHRDCGSSIGLLDLGEPDEYMGYLNGHVYLNVAYTAYLMSQTPAGFDQGPFLKRFSSEEVDLTDYRNPYGSTYKGNRFSRKRTSFFWIRKTISELAMAKRRARDMVESRYREFDRAVSVDLQKLEMNGLREELTHALDYFRSMHMGYLPFYINAFGLYGVLEELCHAWLPANGHHVQNRLKGDMSNLRTVESARDLWALAQALDKYPAAKAMVVNLPATSLPIALQEDAEGQAFWQQQVLPFMRENGVRAQEEMELTHPRWIDDPTYVFQMIKTFLSQGFEVEERLTHKKQADAAQEDTRAILSQLSAPKRAILNRVIALYSGCSRLREETRMAMITSIWLVRRVLVEIADRLVREGALTHPSELAWLDFDDIQQYVNGWSSAAALFPRSKVVASHRLYQSWLDEEDPPLTFIGRASTVAKGLPSPIEKDAMSGLGTSHGQIRARARVIHDLASQASEMKRGEIIVTAFTDASWTPLFALASGVVTDIGSMLSHSSIVAREFGIPSVVNTKNATTQIQTGDEIEMNGETGAVRIVQRARG